MNNLKAERTLTAFDAWFNEQEGYSLRSERFDGDVEWLKAAFEAGALSTQQPMGEVTDEMVERACLSFIPHWYDCTSEVKVEVFRDMRSAISAALHPNQESGE